MRAAQIGNTWAFKLAVPSNNTKAERFFFFQSTADVYMLTWTTDALRRAAD